VISDLHQAAIIARRQVRVFRYARRKPRCPVALRTIVTVIGSGTLEYETTHQDSGVILDPGIPAVETMATLFQRREKGDG